MADKYIKRFRKKLNEGSVFEKHIPNYPQLAQIEDQTHFFYNNFVTYNGRLNYCKKYYHKSDIDSLSGVFTRFYGSNIKDLLPESIILFSSLNDYFSDPSMILKDLGIHFIIHNEGFRNRIKYRKKKIQKELDKEFDKKKDELRAQGIKSNIFIRIDFI